MTKLAESPCDAYPDFKRPNASLFSLPPLGQQSGAKRKLALELLRAERELVEHLVECQAKWTFDSAVEWDSTRSAWAYKIIDLEQQFAWAFSTSRFTQEENKLMSDAYKNSAQLRRLTRGEPKLYRRYIELKDLADEVTARFKYAVDAPTRLSLFDTVEKAKEARTQWRRTANQITQLKGVEIDMVRRARLARTRRGVREMKKHHPETRFTFHTMKDLTTTRSEPMKALLGPIGTHILEEEGGRRRTAIATRGQ